VEDADTSLEDSAILNGAMNATELAITEANATVDDGTG